MALARPSTTEQASSPAERMASVRALVDAELREVNRLIVDRMQSPVSLIPQLAQHLTAAGGKRVRPMLTLLAANMCGYRGQRHIGLATAVEFIHTATLLHDDVVDESDLRRGIKTANAVWGNKAPVLVGDFLFSRAFQLMVADGSLRVLDILANASAIIAEGEVAQLVTTNDTGTTEQAYLEMIAAKTAALFRAAAQVGAVVADRPRSDEEALAAYGQNLGIAFQLVDDALDYSAEQAVLGKTVGDDFREGKITLPILMAFARGDEHERAFWRRTLEQLDQRPEDLDRATGLLLGHGALRDTIERAAGFGDAARRALNPFPWSRHKQALLDIVDFCIDRAY